MENEDLAERMRALRCHLRRAGAELAERVQVLHWRIREIGVARKAMQETAYLLRSPANAEHLSESLAQARRGDYEFHDLADLDLG